VTTLRPLRWTDFLTAYRLASDPDERANARDHTMPTLRGHFRWMRKWVGGRLCKAWTIRVDGKAAGIVRVERRAYPLNEQEMSVVLFPKYRGKRLAQWGIKEVAGTMHAMTMWVTTAYIKKGNRASMGAFRRAGFRFTGRVVNGLSQFVYDGGE